MKKLWPVVLVALGASLIGTPHASASTQDIPSPSQVRGPEEDWHAAAEAAIRDLEAQGIPQADLAGTAYGSAVPLSQIDGSRAPVWSPQELEETFERIRDLRFLYTPTLPDFPRRISWLYPDDGCFARAEMVDQKVREWGHAVPKRLFIFGNLVVRTRNAPGGAVSWWYHIVPAVQVGGELEVIDAAINPSAPLPIREWILDQAPSLKSVRLALCDGVSYNPFYACRGSDAGNPSRGMRDQERFLVLEWNRLIRLGRDPRRELGESPPWTSENEGRE